MESEKFSNHRRNDRISVERQSEFHSQEILLNCQKISGLLSHQ